MQSLDKLCYAVANAHHLLNMVSQDSGVMNSLLTEDNGFLELLTTYAQKPITPEAYDVLMAYVSNNY